MPYHIFQFPLPGPADPGELNAFLESHRIVSVQEHFVPTPGGGLLVFVVQSVDSPSGGASSGSGSKRIDYKAVLEPEQFALFSLLREERKRIANTEGVPIYTIFTNEQLAEMVRRSVRTLPEMSRIEGIGSTRMEKHGARLLKTLTAHLQTPAPTIS